MQASMSKLLAPAVLRPLPLLLLIVSSACTTTAHGVTTRRLCTSGARRRATTPGRSTRRTWTPRLRLQHLLNLHLQHSSSSKGTPSLANRSFSARPSRHHRQSAMATLPLGPHLPGIRNPVQPIKPTVGELSVIMLSPLRGLSLLAARVSVARRRCTLLP
jgi:hypothetical protein